MAGCPVLFHIERREALMGFFKAQVQNRALGTQKMNIYGSNPSIPIFPGEGNRSWESKRYLSKKKKLHNHQIKGEKKEKIIMELYWEEVTSTPRCYGPYKFQSLQKVQEWNMPKRYVYQDDPIQSHMGSSMGSA